MTTPISQRARLWLYLRMIFGAGMLGIAVGYYLQLMGRLEMTPFLVFAAVMRGMIIGAFVWAFEIYWVLGPRGNRLAPFSPAARFTIRIVAYVILGEAGYWIGEALFQPEDIADLFHTAGGDD
jgi:hypothetical protein